MDEQILIESPRGTLVGMLHRPDSSSHGRPGLVFCNAFGEERKSSALTMARLARAVAAAGFAALRFDYYGCGDSEGEFADADVSTRLDDIGIAARFLRERTECDGLVLLGLRLGATLAAERAKDLAGCRGLVLLEPIADGSEYLGGEMRRKLVRQMITAGRGGATRAEMMQQLERDDAILDMDGFALRGVAYKQITALGIRAGDVSFAGPVLVCQIHFNDRPKPELAAACEALRGAGAEVAFRTLVLPPLWSRIEVTLAPELEATVIEWLTTGFQSRTAEP